jgi:uncharacterized RDD family membrane protein YckC
MRKIRITLALFVIVLAALLALSSGHLLAQDPPVAPPAPQADAPPAVPATPQPPALAQPPEAQQPDDAPAVTIRRVSPPAVRIGQDYTLAADQTAREVVVISGSARIDGQVEQDMVVVLGSVHLGPTAVLNRDLVVVGGLLTVEPGAVVLRDMVVVGSGFSAPPTFSAGREQVVVGPSVGNAVEAVLPWVTQGLLWGRLIVPSMPWMWLVVGILFGVYLLLNLVFDRAVRVAAGTLGERPLSAFLVGLLVLLLAGPVSLILAVSIVGIAVLPFLAVALVVAVVLGKVAVMRWIGAGVLVEDEPENRLQSARSFVIGFAVITVMYMVPILGIVTFATIVVFGLGAATMALLVALRRENPKPEPDRQQNVTPPSSPPPFVPPPPMPPDAAGRLPLTVPVLPPGAYAAAPEPEAQEGHTPTAPLGEDPSQAGARAAGTASPGYVSPPPPRPGAAAPAGQAVPLIAMPKADFIDRAAAFGLDVLLVMLTNAILDLRITNRGTSTFFLMLLVYHIAFWTWKGTTVGGIICNLRVIRTDGASLQFGDALVRGLSSIFSLAVVGLGAFWILRDPERQSWHDRIAGTYVVKVPRNYPPP